MSDTRALAPPTDCSYRKCEWVASKRLTNTTQGKTMIRAWQQRQRNQDPDTVHNLLPEWTRVERVISIHVSSKGTQYLVKWCGLPYVDSTWEFEDELLPEDMVSRCYSIGRDLQERKQSQCLEFCRPTRSPFSWRPLA